MGVRWVKKHSLRFSEGFNTIICLKKNSVNVQKIVNDANILIAAMPFSFLLRWDEKVCDGTFLGTGQGSDGKRLGLGEKFRRLQEAEFFFCAT